MVEKRPNRTLGGAHDMFWHWCALGELRLQRCAACARISWPPVEACEHCGGGALAWERMSGHGTIMSWCSFERDYYGGILPIPWDTILVELEEGPLFVSNPQGFGGEEIVIGMAVRLAFAECEDAAGRFSLPVFAPE
jgi:uncharacterized OB-fold protein